MKYEEPKPRTRIEAESALRSEDPEVMCRALVDLAFHDPEWRYVQATCLALLTHPHTDVRGLACTCLGHVARIHRSLDRAIVESRLQRMLLDPEVGGRAQDALDDIAIFMGT